MSSTQLPYAFERYEVDGETAKVVWLDSHPANTINCCVFNGYETPERPWHKWSQAPDFAYVKVFQQRKKRESVIAHSTAEKRKTYTQFYLSCSIDRATFENSPFIRELRRWLEHTNEKCTEPKHVNQHAAHSIIKLSNGHCLGERVGFIKYMSPLWVHLYEFCFTIRSKHLNDALPYRIKSKQ